MYYMQMGDFKFEHTGKGAILKGTEKQKIWAEKLRLNMLEALDKLFTSERRDYLEDNKLTLEDVAIANEEMLEITSAKKIIDFKNIEIKEIVVKLFTSRYTEKRLGEWA